MSRLNQKARTRKDLLQAAASLMQQGRSPTLDDVADKAMVSRATAYRYFSGVETLLNEAALDISIPDPESLFADDRSADPAKRLQKVDDVLHEMMLANETSLRLMMINTLQQTVKGEVDADLPLRQNRRLPLIDAALAPVDHLLRTSDMKMLRKAMALIVGTEAMIVFKDVLRLGDEEFREVKRWAIQALVAAALKPEISPPAKRQPSAADV